MLNQGIGSWPARRARKTPRRTAIVHEDTHLTYRDLHERVLRLAHALRALGVARGDRVAYLGPNHPSFLETLFATGVLGAVFVPLNTRLAAPELAYNLSDSGSTVLVHAAGHAGTAAAAGAEAPALHRITLGPAAEDALGYEELLAGAPADPLDEPVGPDEPCMIMYTSGTTGRPKGAVLSHANITWNSVNVLVDTDLAGDEVTLVVAPLFHTAGLNMTCLPTLLKGGRVVLHGAFDAGHVLEAVAAHRVTYMFGVPTMYDAMAAHPRWRDADLSSLRSVSCGGAPVPARTIETYLARGLAFSQGYGMTEASPGVLFLDREEATAKAGSAGVPHFFTDTRVTAPDGGPAAPGEKGEILVRGPNVMSGYWGRPADTAAAFTEDGWLRTGDVARTDEDGYAYIVDRVKDMFVSGGENVYPAEVEDALLGHPAVRECAVIGVPDAVWGEVGHAVVVLEPGADAGADGAEILGRLHGRLAKYKIPRTVAFVDALPRTASGKIVKSAVRRAHAPGSRP
ncbi:MULTISPECIES: acyl-CoA synthetase [Streptomyces]|uniref:Long-chain fatty acid--CoA ligase n=1 Tax=Streptomyces griseoaurantiacus TaxID=68213 RepID=A0ABZ1UUG3_9ACTN|nr:MULTISPECIES: long-chain fatty acid--CoA ligase [Streptomyces]MCF0086225.1 Long-chain-fatty-acid--CoA ligase FadD13 [Streptomyces sp. MH192]MCF0098602.1 Long-chain-fatty-acid--CoA ligase FadD13 [Streptomyces sp. MH191]MDX3089841.1 long-chain fatty acid--CoA ligase [Streptomyces sp. ME12-02E]MDX3333507.1 long-chain fatty acid--CoA ligase [Streptomyces sp. ME02-6978a]MDX3361919.1 long-chain fatty acid--CoA ligase [Streptomyces sp. ME02-6978.2a]